MMIEKRACSADLARGFDSETNRQARVSAALGYLFFFIPLIMHPESKFARFHANQALVLLIWMLIGTSLLSAVPYAGPWMTVFGALFGLCCGARGVFTALRCEAKRVPLLGKLVIVEYEEAAFFE